MLYINEWRFCLRQPLIQLSMIIMPIFGFLLAGGAAEGNYSPASQLLLTQITLLMLVLPILLGAISPSVFLRDTSNNMTELINTTPISHNKRWLLRYGTVVCLFLLLFVLSFSTILVAYTLEFGFSTELLAHTILNLILLVLPSIMITSAFALWLSTYWQSAMVMYASIATFGISYLILGSLTGSPVLAGSSVLNDTFYNAMLWLDPYGISALLDNINSANAYINNQLLINRLIYIFLSVAVVYIVLNKKVTTKVSKQRNRKGSSNKGNQATRTSKRLTSLMPVSPFIQLIKVSLIALLHSRVTQIIILIWPMLIFNEVLSGLGYAEALSVISTNSIDALNLVAFDMFSVFGAFVVALWSWFICSRDKSYSIAELIAAAPISNRQLVGSQIIALGLMILILLLLTFVGSSLAELMAGSEWIFTHYLMQLSLSGLPLLMLGTLFICIHHLCRSSAISGGIVSLIILIKFTAIMTSLGLTHTLWNIADSPLQAPDNFWGYGASLSVYLPYMTVWLIACIGMVLFAISRSHRGTALGKLSIRGLPKTVLLSLSVALLAGMSFHFALVKEKPLTNSDKREAWQAQYEHSFSDWKNKPQPSIVHIDSEIDIYPTQQWANFKLRYTIENRTTTPISEVLIGRHGNYDYGHIKLDGAELIELDTALNQGIYKLSKKLMPGEQKIMQAEFNFKQSQYWPHRSHQVVKPEFSYLRANPLLPTIGYQAQYQLESSSIRTKYNLETIKSLAPSELFKDETSESGTYQWATLSTVISTQKNHNAISQGELVSNWQEGERSYFKFKTRKPVRAIPTWLSVPYSSLSQETQSTTLNVYAPNNNEAAQVNLKAMTDTLAWFAKHISPYSGAQLNLIAAPEVGSSGYALPQIMLISNKLGFRAKPSLNAGFDQRYRRTVHETAHQWFGYDLGNGVPKERSFLVESMAKYIELVVIEKHYGYEAMHALVESEQKRFESSQRNNLQKPVALIDATREADIHSRATLAFAKLRTLVGDETIATALKSLWLQHAYPKTPATSMDFIRALKRSTSQQHHEVINELFLSTTQSVNLQK